MSRGAYRSRSPKLGRANKRFLPARLRRRPSSVGRRALGVERWALGGEKTLARRSPIKVGHAPDGRRRPKQVARLARPLDWFEAFGAFFALFFRLSNLAAAAASGRLTLHVCQAGKQAAAKPATGSGPSGPSGPTSGPAQTRPEPPRRRRQPRRPPRPGNVNAIDDVPALSKSDPNEKGLRNFRLAERHARRLARASGWLAGRMAAPAAAHFLPNGAMSPECKAPFLPRIQSHFILFQYNPFGWSAEASAGGRALGR